MLTSANGLTDEDCLLPSFYPAYRTFSSLDYK